jgi:hypothetical protein
MVTMIKMGKLLPNQVLVVRNTTSKQYCINHNLKTKLIVFSIQWFRPLNFVTLHTSSNSLTTLLALSIIDYKELICPHTSIILGSFSQELFNSLNVKQKSCNEFFKGSLPNLTGS